MSNESPENAPASGNDPARVPVFLSGIKPPNSLNFDGNKLEHWPLWKQQWANYVVISRLDTQSTDYQTAMLLNSIGTEALKVYNGFVFAPDETRDVTHIIRKFDEHIQRGPVVQSRLSRRRPGFAPRTRHIIRCKNLALYIRDCVSLCLSDETLKAVGPFYLVSMPGEVKDPTSPHWKCVTCRGLHNTTL